MNIIHAGKDEQGSVEAGVLAFAEILPGILFDKNCWVEWVSVFKLSEGWFDGENVISALKRWRSSGWRWRGSLRGGEHS